MQNVRIVLIAAMKVMWVRQTLPKVEVGRKSGIEIAILNGDFARIMPLSVVSVGGTNGCVSSD